MTDYIEKWLTIIENMNNDNTYKLAWGRAILELVVEREESRDRVISFDEIAHKMLKYYWNQVFFFQLKQSPLKTPVLVQETEKCIEFVNEIRRVNTPIWFDKAEEYLNRNKDFYANEIRKISNTLTHDVSWRFLKANGQEYDLYELNRKEKTIFLYESSIKDLKEYAFVLSQLLNYRWAQLLEKFNNSPKIALKVKGISDEKIRRNNLSKFKDILIANIKDRKIIDFYTGEILEENNISVDHVIPWSFMYSDDLWNLVLTSKSNNSKKSNSIPTEDIIKKLEQRNLELMNRLDKKDKNYVELKMAIEQNYVRKFYLSCKL